LVPDTDGLLLDQQVARVMLQPSAVLSYCRRLQQLFEAAGRPLVSIRVISCYSLNGHEYKALYDDTVNLLGYIEEDEGFSWESAVSKWVHDWDTAPGCDRYAPPRSRYGMVRRSRGALVHLQAEAGLRYQVLHDGVSSRLHRRVCHVEGKARLQGSLRGKKREGGDGGKTALAAAEGAGSEVNATRTATGFRSYKVHQSEEAMLGNSSSTAGARLGHWGFSRVHLPWGWGLRCQDGEGQKADGKIGLGTGGASALSGLGSSRTSGCRHQALPLMMRMGQNSSRWGSRPGVGQQPPSLCGRHGQLAYMWNWKSTVVE
jgi:hypothetical protein